MLPMSDKALRIRLFQCAKTFADGTRALAPVDLEVEPGETLVFLGPSGCGKTTLLRIIAGLEAPDPGGRILFDDTDVTGKRVEQRNVGMVFQNYALFPNMTVAENIGYGLRVRRIDGDEYRNRVTELLDMMHLSDLGHRHIDQLSGGQKQRVALARALAARPRALLLDEPLTALDAKLREKLRVETDQLLRQLQITAIYVTHDQSEAMALGDRLAVMQQGRITQIGSPQDIYYRPNSAFVADFVGTMNRLTGTLNDGFLLVPGGRIPCNRAEVEAGVSLEIMFRPEDVRVVADTAAHLRGRIISAFFMGERTRLLIEIGPDVSLIAETTQRRSFSRGEPIALAIDAEALREPGGASDQAGKPAC
jgi:putative spermidine/putrescine transport system ATP-binding protein